LGNGTDTRLAFAVLTYSLVNHSLDEEDAVQVDNNREARDYLDHTLSSGQSDETLDVEEVLNLVR
jgi:hypothetical protein